ncbi:MAG: type II secretion system protein M [Sedimentisphaerales bacterium]|nr:type II secretion system protein M [Sedimentisphaerales bacterium]
MVLSKRERIILAVTLACVGLLVVYKFVVEPVDKKLGEMGLQRTQLASEVEQADILMDGQATRQERWKAQMPSDLRDASSVQMRISKALSDWASDVGLSLSSIRPDQGAKEKELQEMIFTVAGKGTLGAVAQFLWQIETAALPVKIKSMQLGSSSDTGDAMSIQIYLSALYPSAGSTQAPQKAPEATNEEDI